VSVYELVCSNIFRFELDCLQALPLMPEYSDNKALLEFDADRLMIDVIVVIIKDIFSAAKYRFGLQ